MGTGPVETDAYIIVGRGYKMMRWFPYFAPRRPYVPEHDLAGVVVDGNGTALREGDWVFGWIPPGNSPAL